MPAAMYRSVQGPRPDSTPKNAIGVVWAPGSEHSLGHSEPGAQKHSKSHFPAQAFGHSCEWQLGEQGQEKSP